MSNNKGFSLVEIVVVITVLMIILSVVVLNFGNVVKWQLNKCAESIDDNLNSIKVTTLSDSQKNSELTLSDNDGYLYMEINDNDPIKLGVFSVTVYYEDINRANVASVDIEDQSITMSFNNNGAFNEIEEINGMYVKSIVITKGNYTRSIICERLTGKHYISE